MSIAIETPQQLRKLIPNKAIKPLHSVSTLRGLFAVLFEWTVIIGLAVLCEMYFSWPLYILIAIILGARYLALGLIMHEAVHNLISENKFLNEWVAEILCAWPLVISMRSYRIKHLAHHAWLNTDKDPDFISKKDPNWMYPMKAPKLIKLILIQLSGIGIFESFKVMSSSKMKKEKTPAWYHIMRLSYYIIIIGGVIYFGYGIQLLLYWFIPFATWTQMANRLRRVAEHSAIDNLPASLQTRTTIHGILGRFLLSPKNIAFHNEHHLYPGVPSYNLPKIHKVLNKVEIAKDKLHVSKTYSEVYNECTTS
jgi:fatty acid desaturase